MKESKWSATHFRAISLLLLIGALGNTSLAAPGDVDLSFDPGSGVNGTVQALAVQPDGKLIIVGQFSMVKGLLRLGIARLNADGSGDASFDAHAGGGTAIDCVALQPDAKVLIGGSFITLNNVEHNGLARLNADGSVDPAFNTGSGVDNFVYSIVLQPDGKLLIGGYFTTVNGVSRRGIARLNNNGTLDTSFNPSTGADGGVYTVALQSDGKVLIGGNFSAVNGTTRSGIARLNANGSLDPGFNPGASGGDVWGLTLESDGKILVGGAFTNIAGAARDGIARLNANGSLDGGFNPVLGGTPNVDSIVTQPDGDILIGGRFSTVNGTSRNRIARLNANGSLHDQFNPGAGADDTVRFIALQPNGKVMIAGAFTNVAGIPRTRIARLNADGSLDTSFHSGTQGLNFSPFPNSVASLIPLSDGKLLVGLNPFAILGWRPAFIHGTSLYGDARLNADGGRDTNFVGGNYYTFFAAIGIDPDPNHWIVIADTAHAVAVQSDGKVVIAGTTYASDFEGSASEWFPFLQRANADGSVDGSFNSTLTMGNSDTGIFAVATQPGDKLYVGGTFRVDATNDRSVARLNSNGSLDAGFQPVSASGQAFGNRVYALAVQSDGKVLIGGPFSVVNGTSRNGIARLNANGTLDTTFNPGTGTDGEVRAIAVQPDGKVLIGGSFINFNSTPRKSIARLNPNGSLDNTFNAGIDPNATVRAVALQPDGQVLIGGDFLTVNGVLRTYVARLHGDSPAPSLSIARSNAFLIVSWPVGGLSFQLQENTDLSLPSAWSPVALPTVTNGVKVSVTVPASAAQKFFRLKSQ